MSKRYAKEKENVKKFCQIFLTLKLADFSCKLKMPEV